MLSLRLAAECWLCGARHRSVENLSMTQRNWSDLPKVTHLFTHIGKHCENSVTWSKGSGFITTHLFTYLAQTLGGEKRCEVCKNVYKCHYWKGRGGMLRNHCCILARSDSVIWFFFWTDFHQLSNSNFVSKCWVWLQPGYCYFKWQHTWAGKQRLNKPNTEFKWEQNSAGMQHSLLWTQWMTPTNPNHSSDWGLLIV